MATRYACEPASFFLFPVRERMASCAHSPVSGATGLWMQQAKGVRPTCRNQPPIKRSFCSAFDLKLSRREVLSSIFFAVAAAPPLQGNALSTQPKDTGLPIQKIKDIIENDIRNSQYYVTGDLTQSIYEDDCRFVDPTTDIRGVEKYVAAVRLLFDPNSSHHELKSIDLVGPSTIQARWRLEGYLKLPWHPHIQPYEGTTLYRVSDRGLITSHEETWDISLWTALLEFLTPS